MIKDAFSSVQSAMLIAQAPVGVGTRWYQEWMNLPSDGIMPIGKNPVSGHMYAIEGWKQVNGEPHFIVEAWIGRKLLMPRATFNKAISGLGCGAWVLSTAEIDTKRQISTLQKLVDFIVNLILGLKQSLLTKPAPLPEIVVNTVEETYNQLKEDLKPKYLWDTKENIRHSMRVIGDEENLTWTQKDLLCDICSCESGFNINAKRINSPTSIDRGLFQWNNKYHPEITDEIAFDPEQNTRLACKAIKQGKATTYWSASKLCWNKSGKYS